LSHELQHIHAEKRISQKLFRNLTIRRIYLLGGTNTPFLLALTTTMSPERGTAQHRHGDTCSAGVGERVSGRSRCNRQVCRLCSMCSFFVKNFVSRQCSMCSFFVKNFVPRQCSMCSFFVKNFVPRQCSVCSMCSICSFFVARHQKDPHVLPHTTL
jgi:hypothetical protein